MLDGIIMKFVPVLFLFYLDIRNGILKNAIGDINNINRTGGDVNADHV
jgi:hypothetical protein